MTPCGPQSSEDQMRSEPEVMVRLSGPDPTSMVQASFDLLVIVIPTFAVSVAL